MEAYVHGFGDFGGVLGDSLPLLAVFLEDSKLEAPQATEDLCSLLLDRGVIGVGKAFQFGIYSGVLGASHQLVQLSCWE